MWHDVTLFVYLIFSSTYIQSITFIHRHSPRFLSIPSSLVSSVGKTSLGCRAENRTRACLPYSKPTHYHPLFRIRIRIHRTHVFFGLPDLDPSIIMQKEKPWILLFCDSFWLFSFYLWKIPGNVNVPSKSNKQKKLCQKVCFLLASWRSMTKIAGSGSGSISQRHGSADPDPDPHQNVMDPEHCYHLSHAARLFYPWLHILYSVFSRTNSCRLRETPAVPRPPSTSRQRPTVPPTFQSEL